MKRNVTVAILAFVLACPIVGSRPIAAQTQPELHNEMVAIEYRPPTSEKYKPIYQKLKDRRILEKIDALLSPLELKSGLVLLVEEGDPAVCTGANSYYDGRGTLHLCYSWFYMLENEASVEVPRKPGEEFTSTSLGLMPGFTREEVIIGASVSLILHELGHAIFDIQEIPRLGREEDAADMVAAYIIMQFGPSVALPSIKGTYNVWHHMHAQRLSWQGGTIVPGNEADSHSIDIQRSFNFLCIAYGKDPATFQELADKLLPRARKSNCESEYLQADLAFEKTLKPNVDPEKLKAVQAMQILRPEDFKL